MQKYFSQQNIKFPKTRKIKLFSAILVTKLFMQIVGGTDFYSKAAKTQRFYLMGANLGIRFFAKFINKINNCR